MSFLLLISEGIDAGREYVFDQESVVLGRQEDADIVLSDAGVSRYHARIVLQDGVYFIEDMGSANGTKVNGAVVKKKELVHGDVFILGPVVIVFQGQDPVTEPRGHIPPTSAPSAPSNPVEEPVSSETPLDEGDQSTRIVALSTISKQPESDGSTRVVSLSEIVKSRKSSSKTDLAALGDGEDGPTNVGIAIPGSASPAVVTSDLSAVDRARLRRGKSGLSGDVAVRWAEKTGAQRARIVLLIALGLAGLVGGVAAAFKYASSNVVAVVEPTSLTPTVEERSFGLGPGVDFVRPNEKRFDFEVRAASDALAIFHYQARDIGIGELSILVNGVEVGQAPTDAMGAEDRINELVVAPQRLKRNEVNTVNFDNLKNPPGNETWRIANISVETYLLPKLPREQLVQSAADAITKGDELFGRAGIGAQNLYDAWRAYRDAWLRLFALDEKPEEFAAAERKMRESQAKLDASCSKLLLSVTQYLSQGKANEARLELDSVEKYFPRYDQPCRQRADDVRERNDL